LASGICDSSFAFERRRGRRRAHGAPLSPDGARSSETSPVARADDPARARRLNIRAPFDLLAISQNARWAASPNLVKQQITIWDCHSDRVQTNLPARGPARVWFSPESGWLVACVENGYCTWETGTWRPGPSWEARLDSGDPGEVAFCANGRLIAARRFSSSVRSACARSPPSFGG